MHYLILGAGGYIGGYIYKRLNEDGITAMGTSRQPDNHELKKYDICSDSISSFISEATDSKKVAVLCIAKTNIDFCKEQYKEAYYVNVIKTKELIYGLSKLGYFIIFFSSDNVFDGTSGNYKEDDSTHAINCYGRMKVEVEKYILSQIPGCCIFRTAKILGADACKSNILTSFDEIYNRGDQARCISGSISSFTCVEDLYQVCRIVAQKKLSGIYHVVGDESISRAQLAERYYRICSKNVKVVEEDLSSFTFKDTRPLNVSLNNEKIKKETGYKFTSIDSAIYKYIQGRN